jgi:NADH-quinone oxidoreductase subunit A
LLYTGREVIGVLGEYLGIAVSFVLAAGIAAAMVALGSTLGKKHPTSAKLAPFECGKEPFALPIGRMVISFYLTAILFVLFDVELIFLYPWAVVYRALGVTGLIEMAIFLGVLMVGFIYVWDNGALKWQ